MNFALDFTQKMYTVKEEKRPKLYRHKTAEQFNAPPSLFPSYLSFVFFSVPKGENDQPVMAYGDVFYHKTA